MEKDPNLLKLTGKVTQKSYEKFEKALKELKVSKLEYDQAEKDLNDLKNKSAEKENLNAALKRFEEAKNRLKKAQEEAEARAMRAQQQDQMGAQQLAAQKNELDAQTTLRETQSQIAIDNNKSRGSILEKAVGENQLGWEQALAYLNGTPPTPPQQQPQQQPIIEEQDRNMPLTEDAV